MVAAGAQPAEHPAHGAAAPADAELPAVVREHRQPGAVPPLPELAGLGGLAGNGAPSPRGGDVAAARPGAGRCVEAADLLEHEGDEGRRLGAPVQHRAGALTELLLGPGIERGGRVAGEGGEARAVQQQSAVAQAVPAGQECASQSGADSWRVGWAPSGAARRRLAGEAREAGLSSLCVRLRPGHRSAQCDVSGRRISTATGNTWAWPARVKRAGSRWSRMRSRSRCNCSRISS